MEKEQTLKKIKKLWHLKTENRMIDYTLINLYYKFKNKWSRYWKSTAKLDRYRPWFFIESFFVLVPNDKKPLSWARRPVINFIHLLYTEHLSCTLTLGTLRLSSYIHIYMYRAPLGQCHNWRKPLECSYCIFSTVRVWGVTRCICFDIPGQIHLSVLFRVPMS